MQPKILRVKSDPKKEEFKLRISGVELGKHLFSIDCDNRFFELAAFPDLIDGDVKLQIEMEILDKMVSLNFHFAGFVTLPCDRCLDPVRVNLDFDTNLMVKLVPFVEEDQQNDDENLWVVEENTYELDVFHYVYESIMLALPIQILHPDDENGNPTCNPEVLKKLEELSHGDSDKDEIDPRWEALKHIK